MVRTATNPPRAKDVCQALGIDLAPKNVDGVRATLKRLVKREILTETKPGQFSLNPAAPGLDQGSNQ